MSAPSVPLIELYPDATNQAIRFYWAAPASDGGSPITKYTLACSSIAYSQDISANIDEFVVTGLTNQIDYTFTLTATNANGVSPAATFLTVQTGITPFGPTTATASTFNTSTALVTWNLSTIANQAAPRAFLVTVLPSTPGLSSYTYATYIEERSTLFSMPSTNVYYQYLVQAINDVGYCNPFAYTNLLYASPPEFLPTQVSGLQVWLDASVSSNFVLSGSNVIRWLDKSGNGRNGSSIAGTIALQSNTLNGLPTVYFGNSQLSGYSTFSSITSNVVTTGFMVYQFPNGIGSVARQLTLNSGNFVNERYLLIRAAGLAGGISNVAINSGGTGGYTYLQSVANGTYFLSFAQHLLNYDNITFNGSNMTTAINPRQSNYTYNAWTMGTGTGANSGMDGNVAEMLLYQGVLNNSDRQRIEGYLAWKWGLTASLAATHPFKSAAPGPPLPQSVISTNRIIHFEASSWNGTGNWTNLGSYGASNDAALIIGSRTKNAAGNGVSFNGATYYQVSTLGLQSQYTLSAWANMTVGGTFTGGSIFTERDQDAAPLGRAMNMAIQTTNCNVSGFYWKSNGQPSVTTSNLMGMSNYWFQYAYTVSTFNTSSTIAYTYSNGAMVGSTLGTFSTTTNSKEYYIGGRGDVTVTNIRFSGDIGEISVYNVPLTSNQIRQNYEARWSTYYP